MEPSIRKNRTSIALIVIAVIVVSVSVFLALVGFIGYSLFSTREHDELLALNSAQADQASTSLAPALWNFDQGQIEQTVESFMKDKRVYAVSVWDADSTHTVLAMVRDSKWSPVRTDALANISGLLSQERDIHYREKFVGKVKLVATPAFLEKNLQSLRWAISFLIAIVASLLTLALYLLLWRFVLRPIKLLDRYALAVGLGTGETAHSVTVPFLGELETLRGSIAEMIAQLKSRNSELKEQAKSIIESGAFRKRVFDSSRAPIVIMDAVTYKYVDCNAAATEIYRFSSRDEVIGKTPLDFSAPTQYDGTPSQDKVRLNIEKAMALGSVVFEWRHERPDGDIWDAEVHLMSFESGDRRRLLQFTLRDITDFKRAEEELRERESRLRAIFESSRDAIGVAKNGMHFYANPAYLELFGFASNDQIHGTSIINSIAPSHREQMIRRVQRRTAGEEVERFYESRGLRTDGTEFDAEFSLSTYTLSGEVYSVASIRDITERKRAENALRESEAKFKAVIDNSNDSILFCDVDGRILYRSPRTRATGYSDEERVGKIAFDIIYPDDVNAVREAWTRAVQRKNDTTKIEFRTLRRDGTMIFIDATIQNLLDNPDVRALVVAMRDITERKRAEESLSESEEKFSKLFHSSPDAVLLTELKSGKIAEVNKSFESFSGYSRDELIGRLVLELNMYSTEGRQRFVSMLKEQGKIHDAEFDLKNKAGKKMLVLASAEMIEINGEIHTITILHDITERRQIQDALRESEEKYRTLVDSANEGVLVAQDGIIKFVNRRVTELSGYTESELLEKPLTDFIHPEDRQMVLDFHTKRSKGESAPNGYFFRMLYGNRTRWVENNSVLIAWNGRPATLGFLTDVTERKLAEKALIESEERFRRLLESVTSYVYTVDVRDGKSVGTRHSPGCLAVTGYQPEEFALDPNLWISMVPDADRSAVVAAVVKVLREPSPVSLEHRIIHKNGGVRWVNATLVPHLDQSGTVLSYDGLISDVTERKSAEDARYASEERFRQIAETLSDVIFVTDNHGVISYISPSAENVFGYRPEEMTGHFFGDYLDKNDLARLTALFRAAVQNGVTTPNLLLRANRKDGTGFYAELNSSLINDGNSVQGNIGIIRDITERKNAENALRESEDRFRQMAENIEEIFFLYQKEGNKLLYMSPAVTKLFGVDLKVIKADPRIIDRAVHPDDVAKVKFTRYETFYSTPLNEEFRAIAPDGSVHWMRLRSFLIQDLHGNVLRVAGLVADITEFKNAQEETLRRQQQLIQADKMASLGVMVSGIAHEINNPNNFITMSMPLLRQAWESILPVVEQHEKQGGSIKVGSMDYAEFMQNFDQLMNGITEGSQRIKRIVSDLKDYARIETADMNRMFDLNEVTRSAVNLMNNMIRKRTKAFSLDLFKGRLAVKGNSQRLEQVIVNLIHNACDALTSSEQSISITTDLRDDKHTALLIADQGCGISPEDLSRITDPFFTTKRDTGGTGLGLSISAGIVKDHGGELQFQSEPGKGTTVTVLLPIGAQVK